jgi:hypothetical protein
MVKFPFLDSPVLDNTGLFRPSPLLDYQRKSGHPLTDEEDICTSHVERHNLSIRTVKRRFTRLALCFSKKFANLEAAISLHNVHFNFGRVDGTLKMTPAMKAKIAGHPWTLEELLIEAESE